MYFDVLIIKVPINCQKQIRLKTFLVREQTQVKLTLCFWSIVKNDQFRQGIPPLVLDTVPL